MSSYVWLKLGVCLSEPELRHKDVNVDDVLAGVTLIRQVAHGKLQYCHQRTNQSLHLANDTWRRERGTASVTSSTINNNF